MEPLKSENSQRIHPDNWTYCRYRLGDMMAFISYGAQLEQGSPQGILEYYFVVLQNEDYQEFFQKKFPSLLDACQYLNHTYDHWDFEDQTISKEGCGSCQAHD